MTLPEAVKKQIDLANAAYSAAYGEQEAPTETPQEDQQTAESTEIQQSAPADAQAPAAEPAQQPTPQQSEQKGENWEHKFKTLQGMFSSAQQRHQKETRELKEQLASLNLLVSQLKTQQPTPTPTPAKLLKDDEVADYGADMIDVIKRAAKEEILPELEQLRVENEQLKEQVSGVNNHLVMSAEERMYARLDSQVPDWRNLNVEQGFLNWLQQIDPFSGQVRQDMLNNAVASHNAERVVAFFKGYLDQTAAVDYQAQQQDTGARRPQVSLESLVAPARPKSTTGQSAQQSNGKRIWNSGDIQRFYADVRKGAFRNRAAERERIEQEIIAAGREGRVR